MAHIEPKQIENKPEKPKKFDQKLLCSKKTKKHNLKNKLNKTILGAEANNKVTDKIAPS